MKKLKYTIIILLIIIIGINDVKAETLTNISIDFYEYDGSSFNKVSDSILLKRSKYLSLTHKIIGQFYSDKSLEMKS